MTAVPNIFPVLRYRDAAKAERWLADAFGFSTVFSVPGEGGRIAHAELRLGAGRIMIASADDVAEETALDPRTARQSNYVAVPDIDEHYARAVAAGAHVTLELTDMDYGSREYSATDFEGNHWSFGTYQPEPDPDE
ncbi:MAG: glyoxalase [Pseudonocardiaceae bacterium]|nr:glyoxalase [Pseudonocardiaceae bacterium]